MPAKKHHFEITDSEVIETVYWGDIATQFNQAANYGRGIRLTVETGMNKREAQTHIRRNIQNAVTCPFTVIAVTDTLFEIRKCKPKAANSPQLSAIPPETGQATA